MASRLNYTDEQKKQVITDICTMVIDEKISFNEAVKSSPITYVTFFKWMTDSEELKQLYNYAREVRSDILFEEIIDIADNTEEGVVEKDGPNGLTIERGDMTNHRRLKIEARKWIVSKMQPKKYGDKIQTEHSGEITISSLTPEQRQKRIEELKAKLNE